MHLNKNELFKTIEIVKIMWYYKYEVVNKLTNFTFDKCTTYNTTNLGNNIYYINNFMF